MNESSDNSRVITCIKCPSGCQIFVRGSSLQPESLIIEGQKCERGTVYARNEILNPRRLLTTVIRLTDRHQPLPVRTLEPIPKSKYFEALIAVHNLKLSGPVKAGDILLSNLLSMGIALVAAADSE